MDRATACKVLGVHLDSTPEEIRRAYKRRALETHPDKTLHGDSTEFKHVATAYAVLSGQTEHMNDLKATMAHIFTPDFIAQVLRSVICVMEHRRERDKEKDKQSSESLDIKPKLRKPKTIHVEMDVTVEDLYKARVKKLSIKVKRYNTFTQALIDAVHTIYISLKSYQLYYKFKEVGDASEDGQCHGNIMVHLHILNHETVHVDDIMNKHDLYVDAKISLKEYYLAKTITLELFENVVIDIPYTRGLKCAVVPNKGLPYVDEEDNVEKRGTMYVFFELIFPSAQPPDDILNTYFC